MLLVVVITFIIVWYFYNTRNYDYWKKKGIKYEEPIPFFGTSAEIYFQQKSTAQLTSEVYWKYPKERVVGLFKSSTPELLIRDPEIIKRILITDFIDFHLRTIFPYHDDVDEPLVRHIFNANGDLWRLLRQQLTPVFTSVRLKAMFPLIAQLADRLQARIEAAAGATIDAKDLLARFTTDFSGACAFGLDMAALTEENSRFRQLGVKIFEINPKDAVKFLLKALYPDTFKHLKWTSKVEKDVVGLVRLILEQRNYEPSGRNDFIDLLLECKKKGLVIGDSIEKFKRDGTSEKVTLEMTDDLIAAQVFLFFAAGFETSSFTSSYTLHMLAYHPDVQKKVQDEIDRVLVRHDNKLSYDCIKEMSYLKWAFKEGMRMFPSVGFLTRQCARKYKFLNMDLTIDKGVRIIIPVQALHSDPQYFDHPDEFRPERFDPKNIQVEKIKCVYLPFGDGQRSCIGARFGIMQSMAGMVAVLSKFSVEPAPTSVRHPVVEPNSGVVQFIRGGLPLLFKERKKA